MSEDPKKPEVIVPIYAPPEQTIIPGYKKYVPSPPKDWRKWEDGRGNKIDSPGYQGPQSTGKIIPPLTDSHGRPIQEGSLQVVRDAKGAYRIVDWSLPVDRTPRDEDDEGRTLPIMGRCIYETKYSFERVMLALRILAKKKEERDAGLPEDPVQCKDLSEKPIFIGRLVLARFARGKFAGCYAIVDTAQDIAAPGYRLVCKKDITLKQAVGLLTKESKKPRKAGSFVVTRKKFVAAGAPISFAAPEGFGGFGAGNRDREGVAPDSLTWDVTVDLYARTGKWCQSAKLIWCGEYPPELVEQCENYRAEYLEDPSKFYDNPAETTDDDVREIAESNQVVRDFLEYFEGSVVIDPIASPETQKAGL